MEQYDKSAPPADTKQDSPAPDLRSRLQRLEDTQRRQQDIIAELQTEIRRLKAKLDQHADYLNRQTRG